MRHVIGIVTAWVICTAAAAAEPPRSPLGAVRLEDGDTIVFLGDSITAQCKYTQYLEDYFYTRFPHLKLRFHNAGVSGDTIADALVRFDRDVAAYKPKYVTVLLGMNDGASTRFDEGLFETYRADMRRLIDRIRAIDATPILLSPTMYDLRARELNPKPDSRGRGGYYNGVLALYGAWLRELATDEGLGFVDLYTLLNQYTIQQRKTNPLFTLVPDGIHPDPGGQMIMVFAFVSDLGLSRRSSTIDVSIEEGREPTAKVTGGKVSELRTLNDGLSFVFEPNSLPMPVPTDAMAGARLIPLGHRMSYEALYIHGLSPGTYELTINGQPVGKYGAEVLESKVELESNERTPQYQQAMQVAALNARRNEEAVIPLRDLWRARKTLLRTDRELAAAPTDETLKKRVTAYEKKLAGFDEQIQAFEAKGQEIESQIRKANQPQRLEFRLTRVGDKP